MMTFLWANFGMAVIIIEPVSMFGESMQRNSVCPWQMIFIISGELSCHGFWQSSVTPPECICGADVGMVMLPGYPTLTGADLSVV